MIMMVLIYKSDDTNNYNDNDQDKCNDNDNCDDNDIDNFDINNNNNKTKVIRITAMQCTDFQPIVILIIHDSCLTCSKM